MLQRLPVGIVIATTSVKVVGEFFIAWAENASTKRYFCVKSLNWEKITAVSASAGWPHRSVQIYYIVVKMDDAIKDCAILVMNASMCNHVLKKPPLMPTRSYSMHLKETEILHYHQILRMSPAAVVSVEQLQPFNVRNVVTSIVRQM